MYKTRDVARELSANLAMSIPWMRDWRIRRGRTMGASMELKARAFLAQFAFFMDTIGYGEIEGKTVVEIGPGDAVPLAPLFIAAGARRYVAIDRFLGNVASPSALELYRLIARMAPSRIVDRLRAFGLDSDDDWRQFFSRPDRIGLVRRGIESEAPGDGSGADYLLSFNVCEHLENLPIALRNMKALLAPRGCMIHRVDYGPHDVWQRYDNPLTFLTIPQPLWQLISSQRGCPNRVRHAQLLNIAKNLGLRWLDRVGAPTNIAYVRAARPHLAKDFRALEDHDLAVLDAEVVFGVHADLKLGSSFAG